jgi:RecA/RadA recombinase
MQKLNICAVFTAHLTDNIGGYGPKKMVAGGTILGFAPSVEVRYSSVNAEAETEQSAKGTQLVKIRAEIIKSRLGTARKRVKFDLDMQKGLDPYAGLFDILNDYQFVIPALANVDEQIKEKKIPKKSSGWWMFVPWDTTFDGMFNKLVEVGALRADSRKFRESKIKEWARDYEWFIPEMQKILDSIYTRDLTQDAENQEKETEEVEEEGAEVETLNEEKTKKNKKSPKVEITEVT